MPADIRDQSQFAAKHGWLDLVDQAIARGVDLVLLSGDVVERANRYFEAFGPLEEGIAALARAGIPVVAVAGNHDYDVLPKLASTFTSDQFRLLGAGGRWERHTVVRGGSPVLHIDGWSFPARHVRTSPLATYRPDPTAGAPLLGLLHTDLDQADSRYAPVSSAELLGAPPNFWLLGHIHKPILREANDRPRFLYPGSLTALNPTEPGGHGPWLLTVQGRLFTVQHIPRSPVRYENLPVDLTGVADPHEVDKRIARTLRDALVEAVSEQGDSLRQLIARMTLTGRTPLHRKLAVDPAAHSSDLKPTHGGAAAVIDKLRLATDPQWDLAAVAKMAGPPGVLAGYLLTLREAGAGNGRRQLLVAARDLADHTFRPWQSLIDATDLRNPAELLDDDGIGADAVLIGMLEQQGLLLLDELLAQKEESS